ncbi:hypothetical protein ANME2D_02351 [Candidatus Methanoperedens nitroreducens]|uniref:ASCH domain-containing protein n=1 Tax=Candidatus Methanoperedens nitratireducens TaxID=1392998 RepID=A0A062UX93_9EURY|nr:hypothetical protein [Candidatus Methanoperedens nitroreducens]KCZ71616.1 hypothetical protein ANME2D_02351 [Candidatus Methanoperedens nitroreducens]MDJ1421246.1 hypothetical protein [Candidatus Methanoperedens sp.]
MPLMPFSIDFQVPLILDGRKRQTTRLPRKTPLKVEDILYCYYKPRQKKSCSNCLVPHGKKCLFLEEHPYLYDVAGGGCASYTHFFGKAEITSIIKARHSDNIPEYEIANYEPLMWKWSDGALNDWAVADGFNSFEEADTWFSKSWGPAWKELEWDIITFEPDWVKPEQEGT